MEGQGAAEHQVEGFGGDLSLHEKDGEGQGAANPSPRSTVPGPGPDDLAEGHRSDARLTGGGNVLYNSRGPDSDAVEQYELVDYASTQLSQEREDRRVAYRRRKAEKIKRLDEEDEMKFSHSIQFNAVPDWSSHYIAYSNLKKFIYSLEKNIHRPGSSTQDAESSPLIQADGDPDQIFARALDVEMEKISSFYQLKELEIYGDVSDLLRDEEAYADEARETVETENGRPESGSTSAIKPRQSSISRLSGRPRRTSTISHSVDEGVEDSDDEDDETTALQSQKPSAAKRSKSTPYDANVGAGAAVEDMRASTEFSKSVRRTSVAYDDYAEQAFYSLYSSGITLKKRTISLYVQLCELKSFVQLNRTGFKKVLKKYDKILDRNLKEKYLEMAVDPAYPFKPETTKQIEENIQKMEQAYADIVTQGDVVLAKKELRLHLREHVVWERNTVWREMIGIERKAQAANMGIRRTLLGVDDDPSRARLQGDDEVKGEMKELQTPVGPIRCPTWLFSFNMFTLIGIFAVFFVLLFVPIMHKPEQQNCLAMLVFVSLLWATEVIPLFVTSLLIPFLCVVLRVVRSDDKPHHRLGAKQAAGYIFASMWTPVIMLLLGGFTIAAALSKYDIAKRIATFVLSKAGTRPRTVLITNMFVAAFASMWISNVAAPVLCFSIIQPMLRNLPSDSNMSKALILGIALASNVGGMLSPIASPQNIVALAIMSPQPSWGVWFFVALPVGIISILLIWLLLLVTFRPGKGTDIVPIKPVRDKFTGVQWFISLVTLGTIVLWCVTHQLEDVFGDMGVVAIIPLALFFGTGILTKEDFNNFLWTIIILAAGGLSLGKAVNSSGLLHAIASSITDEVEGMSLYGILVVFSCLILVVATFISHTVAALIILPLVYSVGTSMDDPHPNLLVMGSALMCSAAMGLPTSGFPNMTAIMMEDSLTGQRYLQVKHFISRGIPSSLLTLLVVITVGYGAMLIVDL
ncbi:MAG: low-affinity phosphate transporter [Claussenomyces sp. TS43310]|nr:MAG: low-affinity phosphate transporter [Claussenomyces sp. TS43310]